MNYLRIINCGMGRDSIAMVCLLHAGKLASRGKVLKPPDVSAVVFADPGYEWEHTYRAIPHVRAICDDMGVACHVIEKPPEAEWQADQRAKGDRTTPAWVTSAAGLGVVEKAACGAYHNRLPIVDEYERNGKITARASASCTLNHKVLPIRRLLSDLCEQAFGVPTRRWFTEMRRGAAKHEVIIGIAADEASRAIDTGRPLYEQVSYPLVDMGITKPMEDEILTEYGLNWVYKSGCQNCHFQPLGWYWVLSEQNPGRFERICHYEEVQIQAKVEAGATPMFLQGTSSLREGVPAWRLRNPTATHEAVMTKSYARGGGFGGVERQCAFAFSYSDR